MSTPKITHWEDRGNLLKTHPESCYGYVYFDNGSRVGFALDVRGHEDVWEPGTNGGGRFQAVTEDQLRHAAQYLREQGLSVNYPLPKKEKV